MDNELFKQQAKEKIQEYCDALTEKPDYLSLYIGKPPDYTIRPADLQAMFDSLDLNNPDNLEYPESDYVKDNGFLLFSCELTTYGYKVQNIDMSKVLK